MENLSRKTAQILVLPLMFLVPISTLHVIHMEHIKLSKPNIFMRQSTNFTNQKYRGWMKFGHPMFSDGPTGPGFCKYLWTCHVSMFLGYVSLIVIGNEYWKTCTLLLVVRYQHAKKKKKNYASIQLILIELFVEYCLWKNRDLNIYL